MKVATRITAVLALLCWNLPLHAADAIGAISARSITLVTLYRDHAVLKLSPSFDLGTNCGTIWDNDYVAIDWSAEATNKNLLAAALMASTTGQAAAFATNGPCYVGFGGGIPSIYRIDLTP